MQLAKSTDPSNKEIAAASVHGASVKAATPASRTPGEEKKTTQVIVKNNASDAKKQEAAGAANNQNQSSAVQQVNTGLVPALATAYKDEKRYALVIGNPSRQTGWMSEFGHKLKFERYISFIALMVTHVLFFCSCFGDGFPYFFQFAAESCGGTVALGKL